MREASDYLFNLECLQKGNARRRFRQDIFAAWKNKCAYCGCEHGATLDHVEPKANGGKTERRNLVSCCGSCNLDKSSEDWFIWFRRQEFWTTERENEILLWICQTNQTSIVKSEPESSDFFYAGRYRCSAV